MLDLALSPTLPQVIWQQLEQTAALPCEPEEFFAAACSYAASSRRSHRRIPFRGRASMQHGPLTSGVYTIDLSPNGVGLYSPVQLLPKQHIDLHFDQCDTMQLVVRRCRRVDESCYICGTNFLSGPLATIPYRDLIRQLES